MTITVYLVRHAAHELIDRVLVGCNAAVELSAEGLRQAQALGRRFADAGIAHVHSSPQPRARQTAEPIAKLLGIALEIAPELDELDTGTWAGRPFDELKDDPGWERWNSARDLARPPGGESMAEVQMRVTQHIERVRDGGADRGLVAVSHAEPIRAAVLHYLRRSSNEYMSVRIDPGSITTIELQQGRAEVVHVNESVRELWAA